MKKDLFETMDWSLWFYWIMATTVGWVVGNLLFGGIPIVIAGAAISAMQWAVLHGRLKNAWQWGIFSTIGWVGGYILLLTVLSADPGILLGPGLGLAVGIPQWLILRKEVNWAGWWIIMSIIGWTTGLTILPGLLTSGALPGAWTGLTLVLLFRYSTPLHRNNPASETK